MKKIFTLIAAAFLALSAQAASDLTLNASETVAFSDWGFDNSGAPTLVFGNWATGGGWQFATPLSQDDYCGVDFAEQSIDVPTGSTGIKADFAFTGGITKIGFKYGDWEATANENGASITITSAVVKANSTGEVIELSFADLNPGEDESIKDAANQAITLTRYSTYPAWYFDPALNSDDYEKVVITFAEAIPEDGLQLNCECDGDNWSGTSLIGLTKGATKVTAYFSAKPGASIKSIGFYYSWNSKQGTDDVTTLKIASAKLIKKPGSGTGIHAVTATQNENETIYTLSGQRVASPVKGINIISGKKVVIK